MNERSAGPRGGSVAAAIRVSAKAKAAAHEAENAGLLALLACHTAIMLAWTEIIWRAPCHVVFVMNSRGLR